MGETCENIMSNETWETMRNTWDLRCPAVTGRAKSPSLGAHPCCPTRRLRTWVGKLQWLRWRNETQMATGVFHDGKWQWHVASCCNFVTFSDVNHKTVRKTRCDNTQLLTVASWSTESAAKLWGWPTHSLETCPSTLQPSNHPHLIEESTLSCLDLAWTR